MLFLIGCIIGLLGGTTLAVAVMRKLGKLARRSIFWEGVLRVLCSLGAPKVYQVVVEPENPKAEEKPEEVKVDHDKALADVFRREMGLTSTECGEVITHIQLTCQADDTLEHKIFEGLNWFGGKRIASRPSGLVVAKY